MKYEDWVKCCVDDVALNFTSMTINENLDAECYDYLLKGRIAKTAK